MALSRFILVGGTLVVVLMAAAPSATAQIQTTGVPGSPSATTTLDGRYLPNPPAPFGGAINLDATTSTPSWPATVVPPTGAPNVLLIITDDVGYGAPSTFGGLIPTPSMDGIANKGLRLTQFHSTALCSPTRAALITGRNHHSVGFGVITEISTGYPGYNSVITKDKATIGTILRDNGYATSWFGKNHNTPSFQASQVGPFDQWPIGMGFDYFYGFMGGETNQWEPGNLVRNTTPIHPYTGKPGWNLTTAMADDAISYLNEVNALAPQKPFFLYYAPGGTHAPHHPTPDWIAKFKGKFDMGWNVAREQIFANQKRLGVIPQSAKLTPWPTRLLKNWTDLSADEKRLYARQMEVYAAYLAYTDHEIGRVIKAVEDMGKLDDTLIIYISGDNGSSAEGTPNGTPNEMTTFNGIDVPVAEQLKYLNVWGSDQTYPHMAVGWTWAMGTPFKWTKQVASHFGGTRQGVAISWPNRITDAGGIRHHFHHVIDVVPTILEAAGIAAPLQVNGIAQKPIEGTSMSYLFDKASAGKPSTRTTQYFEMAGMRALYHEGWMASTTPYRAPWDITAPTPTDIVNGVKWELYDITTDWTQFDDIAAANPAKVKELQDLFWVEANKYQVLPLDASGFTRVIAQRPSITAGRTEFSYVTPVIGILPGNEPNILNKSYVITADVTVPASGGEGVLVTDGGRFGGYGLYLLKGRPVLNYNLEGVARFRWEGAQTLAPGRHTISFDFKYDGPGFGKGGTGVLSVDGKEVARHSVSHTVPFIFGLDESFDVGSDTGTPVDDKDYRVPFAFDGTLHKLTFKLGPLQMSAADKRMVQDRNGTRD
jgi:arylsulfatase A-like enzyme